MSVQLNHTIVHSRDREHSAEFLSAVLGVAPPIEFGPFLVVEVDNGVSLDFIDAGGEEIDPQHYAFLVSEAEFDDIMGRLAERGVTHFADPGGQRRAEINHHDGGRGAYFADPSGHWLEILTRPYGSGAT
jgi:catechol 2,3-dioxygenase-like lactoylglutathione lyase family enzyme